MKDVRPAGSFSASAWDEIAGWRAAITGMPFIRALADGTLSSEAFAHYLAQDAAYLVEFARVLSLASQLAPDREAQRFFAASAHQVLEVESALHRDWLSRHRAVPDISASPVTAAYTDHLLAVAVRDGYAVLTAAVLPCYWLYAYVGTNVLAAAGSVDGHPYGQWIVTYADPAFHESCDIACDLADRAAERADGLTRARMMAAFVRSSMHEYLFFDQGMSRPPWPTPPLTN